MKMPKISAPPKKAVCAVSGLPAKYFDPVMLPFVCFFRPHSLSSTYFRVQETKKPYANIAAFKTLRKIAA
jgi:hypothetical protein